VPKETKKFINPLLRPSQQEVEPKQEKAPKQEKSAPASPVQSNRSQSARQPGEQEEKSEPTPPRQATAEPELQAASTNGDLTQPRTPKTTRHNIDPNQQSTSRQESGITTLERGGNSGQTYELQPETLRAHANQTLLRPETPSYDPRVSAPPEVEEIVTEFKQNLGTQGVPDVDEDINESDDDAYEPETDFGVTTTKARRKRGDQAFERTHVRFTVWVDKSLKQSFEDIASQRDKPKTTLLNEAIADLVRKYEAP
jgi:hypothetical protein